MSCWEKTDTKCIPVYTEYFSINDSVEFVHPSPPPPKKNKNKKTKTNAHTLCSLKTPDYVIAKDIYTWAEKGQNIFLRLSSFKIDNGKRLILVTTKK